MRRAVALLLGALAALAGPVLGVAPAGATTAPVDAGATISQPRVEGGDLLLSFSTAQGSGAGFDPDSVEVGLRPLGADSEPVPLPDRVVRSAEQVERTVVLVVDTSGSLREDDGIEAVREAALGFLEQVDDAVEVGLVTFGQPPEVVSPPTTDRAALVTALEDVEAAGGTALNDAVVRATRLLPDTGTNRLLVLTDGRDESAADDGSPGSFFNAAQAATEVEASGAQVVPIAFTDRADTDRLAFLAGVPESAVVDAADDAQLAAAFDAVAESLAQDVAVQVPIPRDLLGRTVEIVVTATVDGRRVADSAVLRLVPAAGSDDDPETEPSTGPTTDATGPSAVAAPFVVRDVAAPPAPRADPLVVTAAAAAVGAALLVAALATGRLARAGSTPEARRRRSLAAHGVQPLVEHTPPRGTTATGAPTGHTLLGDSAVARGAVELADRVVRRRPATARLAADLEAANLPLRPGEWLILQVLAAAGSAVLLLVLSAGAPLAAVLGLVLGLAGPPLYLSVRKARRRRAFVQALPDTLGLMASGLRAGFSVPQAMESVVREGQEPLRGELNRALVEARLGVPPEDALEHVADRMQSQDFRWVVMSMRIQREVGGNLSEVLDTVGATIRERARLQRQVDALSAEGRLSAWIIGVLPVVFTVYLSIAQPEYLRPLVAGPLGLGLLGVGGVLFALGVLGLRWATRVDV
ncbi:type II secretion system F family protein [Aquipuribacter nitratireducens]|uniref:Type II secretion system F family protein n=1 Tax=Aquipuribacter nitratireducens TaxID=650104 RepID=A0ABW0GSQ7_9MICO